jgi:cytochrome c
MTPFLMSLLGLPGPFSREARRKTGAPPSWEADLSTRPRANIRSEGPDEKSAHASLRRREKYAAAVVLAVAISALVQTAWAGGLTGDSARGETLYEACTDCHSLDKNDVGPRHRGVFGRKAASLPDYDYSDVLKSSNIVWNEETLDKWLTDPQAFVPGVKMFFHLDNAQDRADVIAYLKERAK